MADDLQQFLDSPPLASQPLGWLAQVRDWTTQHRLLTLISVAALLVVVAVGTAARLLRKEEQPGELAQAERLATLGQSTAESKQVDSYSAAVAAEVDRVLTEDTRQQAPRQDLVGQPVNLLPALNQGAERIAEGAADDRALQSELHRKYAQAYFRLGAYRESVTHYQAALDLLSERAGPADPPTLVAGIGMSEALSELGEWDKAEALLRKCLDDSRRMQGIEHPLVRDCVVHLYKLAQLQGKDAAARDELLDVLRQHIDSRQDGSAGDDGDTLKAVQGLAELLADSGDHDTAMPLLQQAVAGFQRLYGPEHQETLDADACLARSLQCQGQSVAAEAAMQQVLETRRRVLGDQHLETLESANNLAVILAAQGKLDEAERLMREAHAGCQNVLGSDHPQTIDSALNVAHLLLVRNKLPEAEQVLRDNWDAVQRTRGKEHVQTINVGLMLSRLLREQGDYDAAEMIAQENYEAAQKLLGPEHTIRGEAVIQLSLVLRALYRPDEADAVESKELAAIFRKEESVADSEMLAAVFLGSDDLEDAEQWERQALDIKCAAPSQHAPISVATTLCGLGRVLTEEGKLAEAEESLRECLTIRREALVGDNWLIAETESLLGDCLTKQGKYADAEPLVTRAFADVSPSGSSDHLRTIESLQRIVDLYDSWDKKEEAVRWSRQLEQQLRDELASLNAALPPDHWLVFDMQNRLGACLAVLEQTEEARSLLHTSHAGLAVHWLRERSGESKQVRRLLRQSADRLIWLLERCDESELAAAWRTLQTIELKPPSPDQALEAATTLETVCREHPDSADYVSILGIGYYGLAIAAQRANKSADAVSWYSKTLDTVSHLQQADPGNALAGELVGQCFRARARLQSKLGQWSEALADYDQGLQKCPEDWNLARDAAWAMADVPDPALRDLEKATLLARQVTEHDPENPLSWQTLGSAQYRAGQWDAAAESFNRDIQLSNGESGLHELLFLAMIHWQRGDKPKAHECYQDALALMKKNRRNAPELVRYRNEAAKLLELVPSKTAKKKSAAP